MALSGATPPTFGRSPHLVGLVAEVERLAAAIGGAPTEARDRLARQRADEVVLATLVLDGADGDALPGADEAAAALASAAPVTPDPRDRRGTWLDALRTFEDPSDRQVRALEVLGARAADTADDLAPALTTEPGPALAELHRRLTRGLVAEERAGAPRITEQAVHDGSTGRVVFFTSEPKDVPGELALLEAWLATAGTREHGLIVSGVLHHELLRIHPFDAANGRLARAASRLVLRARGLDPDHLAAPEPTLALDAMGYVEEVARTMRRRDLTIWLERWGEAVAAGLRDSARRLGVLGAEVPAASLAFLREQPVFTVADHRAHLGLSPAAAREQLEQLLDAGAIERRPGTRGLRFVAVDAVASGWPPAL